MLERRSSRSGGQPRLGTHAISAIPPPPTVSAAAPMLAGIDSRKESRNAVDGSSLRNNSVLAVTPDREMPERMANPWALPTEVLIPYSFFAHTRTRRSTSVLRLQSPATPLGAKRDGESALHQPVRAQSPLASSYRPHATGQNPLPCPVAYGSQKLHRPIGARTVYAVRWRSAPPQRSLRAEESPRQVPRTSRVRSVRQTPGFGPEFENGRLTHLNCL